jgi:hypothetical protein
MLYNIADIYGQWSEGITLIFNVAHIDQPPAVYSQTWIFPNNRNFNGVLPDYSDPDDEPSTLSFRFTTLPTNGMLYYIPDYPTNSVKTKTFYPAYPYGFYYVSSTPFAYGTNFDSFSYYVQDGSGSNSPVVTDPIIIQNVQQPAVSTTPTNFTFLENSSNNITFTGSDPDGNRLYFEITSFPAHGTLIFDGDLNLTNYQLPIELTVNPGVNPVLAYIPDTNYVGVDGFNYTIQDQLVSDPEGPDQPVPCSITLDIAQANPPPVISGQTGGITVHEDANQHVNQDGIINSLVVTDPVSQTNGDKITLTIQSLDEGTNTTFFATATSTVTVTNLNNYTLQVEGTPNDINSLIATNHIYYLPTVKDVRFHLMAIANDEGNTAYGPQAPPQQTTNTIAVNFVTP